MTAMVMAFLFGLVGGDPATLIDKHYVRITSEADKPDTERVEVWPDGHRTFPYSEARYGARLDKGQARGSAVVARVRRILGEPMSIQWGEEPRWGYMWRSRKNPGLGMLLVLDERSQWVGLRTWIESDRPRIGGLSRSDENEIYRWFDWLTDPETEGQ
ncbi:MAG: hypothetical protein R3F65_26855 [bacterium]